MVTGQMQIGQLAEHIGTSPRSLRHYEQQGLLAPDRGENGYRLYGQRDIIRAGNIRQLLDAGLTIADVRTHLTAGCLDQPLDLAPRCSAELETVHARMEQLDELIGRLQHARDRLAAHNESLERVLPAN